MILDQIKVYVTFGNRWDQPIFDFTSITITNNSSDMRYKDAHMCVILHCKL